MALQLGYYVIAPIVDVCATGIGKMASIKKTTIGHNLRVKFHKLKGDEENLIAELYNDFKNLNNNFYKICQRLKNYLHCTCHMFVPTNECDSLTGQSIPKYGMYVRCNNGHQFNKTSPIYGQFGICQICKMDISLPEYHNTSIEEGSTISNLVSINDVNIYGHELVQFYDKCIKLCKSDTINISDYEKTLIKIFLLFKCIEFYQDMAEYDKKLPRDYKLGEYAELVTKSVDKHWNKFACELGINPDKLKITE